MNSDSFFPCRQCDRRAFLIMNLCDKCDPDVHASYKIFGDFMQRIEAKYAVATGKSSLEDWHNFQPFLESELRNDPKALQAFMVATR